MANRQTRDPGRIRTFEGFSRIRTDVASFAADTGQAWRALARGGAGFAQRLGELADAAAAREGQVAGLNAGAAAGASYLEKRAADEAGAVYAGAKPYKVGDPVATDLPVYARAFLNAVAGGESDGAYNVRYTPDGPAFFDSLEKHPAIFVDGPHGKTSAAGRYQFTKTTWDSIGGGDFSPANQDRKAWELAQRDYRIATGKDLAADLQTGGLTPDIVNSLSGTWVAFGSETGRHVATYGASLKRFAGIETPAKARGAIDVPDAPDEDPLSVTPLALRRDGTIRGKAFDAAAISAYSWRVQEGISNDLQAAFEENRDDPAAFDAALNEVKGKYLADETLQDPKAREIFERAFEQRSQAYSRKVATLHEARLRNEQVVAATDGIDALTRDIEKQAYLLGASPEGDDIVAGQIERAGRSIDASVTSGILTPAAAAQMKDGLAETSVNARIRGVFDAMDSPDKQEAFALQLMEDWADGEGLLKDFSYGQVKALSDTLYRDARAARNERTVEQRLEAARVLRFFEDDIASVAATGRGLDFSELGYTPEEVIGLVGKEKADEILLKRAFAEKAFTAVNGMELQTEADIATRLETLKPREGEPGYLESVEIFKHARDRAQEVLKGRATDPLGQADTAGAVDLQPIDAPSTETLQTSLQKRRDDARAVSNLYGTPLTIFRPAERAALVRAMTEQPTALPEFAIAVRDTFGDATPAVLAEISEQGPMLAHVAGIAAASGDASVAVDVARVMEAKSAGAYKATMPSDNKFALASFPVTSQALMALPKTRGAVLETATRLYEQAANTQGFDPSKVDEEGSDANSAWNAALNRALGARTVGGVQYGGVAEVNDVRTIVPHDMPAGDLERLVRSIDAADLSSMPEIGTASGVPVKPGEIRNARLVAIGDGQYYMALGDPASTSPRYLQTPGGEIYRFDARALYEAKGRDLGFSWSDLWRPLP